MPTEIRFEPTLFLLLGTSPGQIGWRLKELLHRAYGPVPLRIWRWGRLGRSNRPRESSEKG
jgi:hypothetical protein